MEKQRLKHLTVDNDGLRGLIFLNGDGKWYFFYPGKERVSRGPLMASVIAGVTKNGTTFFFERAGYYTKEKDGHEWHYLKRLKTCKKHYAYELF